MRKNLIITMTALFIGLLACPQAEARGKTLSNEGRPGIKISNDYQPQLKKMQSRILLTGVGMTEEIVFMGSHKNHRNYGIFKRYRRHCPAYQ